MSASTGFAHCPIIDRDVSIDQTEGQCRDSHHCPDGDCPLANEFLRDWPRERAFNYAMGGWAWWFAPGAKRGQ